MRGGGEARQAAAKTIDVLAEEGGQPGFAGWVGRNVVLAIGLVVAGVMFALSAWMNFRFGLTLGASETEQWVYGLASVTSDAFKALLPFLIIGLWRGHKLLALAAILVWLLCVSWSLASAIGFASSTRDVTVATREATNDQRAALRERAERLEAQIALLPTHRPAGALQAAIANADVPREVWTRTSQCTDVTIPASLEACRGVLALRQELAVAEDSARLEQALEATRRELGGVAVIGDKGDPQAETIGFVTGLEAGAVRGWLALLITALIETGSSLGFTIVALGSRRLRGRLRLPSWRDALGDPETRHAGRLRAIERRGELGEARIRSAARLGALEQAKADGVLREQRGEEGEAPAPEPAAIEAPEERIAIEPPDDLPLITDQSEAQAEEAARRGVRSTETPSATIGAASLSHEEWNQDLGDDSGYHQQDPLDEERRRSAGGGDGSIVNFRARLHQRVKGMLTDSEREAARRRREDPDRDESA